MLEQHYKSMKYAKDKIKILLFLKAQRTKVRASPYVLETQRKQLTLNHSAALGNMTAPKSQQNDQLAHPLLPKWSQWNSQQAFESFRDNSPQGSEPSHWVLQQGSTKCIFMLGLGRSHNLKYTFKNSHLWLSSKFEKLLCFAITHLEQCCESFLKSVSESDTFQNSGFM